MNKFNYIKTERLLIRTLEMKDKDDFLKYRSLPEVYKYQTWRPKNINEIKNFICKNVAVNLNTANTWLQLAICLDDGQLIGDLGILFLDDNFQVKIGITISPAYQGNGYAIEAAKAVISYLFNDLKKHRVTASVDPDNNRSINLLENLGLRKEAHFIKNFRMNDKWYDDCIYAVLEDEWQ